MKQSKRLLIGTMLALYAVLALNTAISRVFINEDAGDPRAPQFSSQEQLDALRDFAAIRIEGDFGVEVVQQDDYAIEIRNSVPDRGDLLAGMEAGVLRLRGYGNPDNVRVRVGMPRLTNLSSGFSPFLSITGFSGEKLDLRVATRAGRSQRVELHENNIENLQLRILDNTASVAVQLDSVSMANGVEIYGSATVTVTD